MPFGFAAGLAIALAGQAGTLTAAPTAVPKPSRFVEIDATTVVMTAPRKIAGNGGKGHDTVEFEVELKSYLLAPDQPAGSDKHTEIDMMGLVTVEHDARCGELASIAVSDQLEIRGEYVDVPGGQDRIRFTHAPGAPGCGDAKHPAGFIRKATETTPTPRVTPPAPSGVIPDQPFVGTPVPRKELYAPILKMKADGATDEQLLARIAQENRRYALTTEDLQKLRDAGLSQRVVEAMLRSGRATPAAAPTRTPTPGS